MQSKCMWFDVPLYISLVHKVTPSLSFITTFKIIIKSKVEPEKWQSPKILKSIQRWNKGGGNACAVQSFPVLKPPLICYKHSWENRAKSGAGNQDLT